MQSIYNDEVSRIAGMLFDQGVRLGRRPELTEEQRRIISEVTVPPRWPNGARPSNRDEAASARQ